MVSANVASAASVPVRAPVGRPPLADKAERMAKDAWWAAILDQVKTATEVEIAVYCFDDLALFNLLLKRLQDKSKFTLKLSVDKEMFQGGTPKNQLSRVSRLSKQDGCDVWLCSGSGRLGAYHVKELITDRRYLFTGSANLTCKSHQNRERLYRMTGSLVALSLQDMAAERQDGKKYCA